MGTDKKWPRASIVEKHVHIYAEHTPLSSVGAGGVGFVLFLMTEELPVLSTRNARDRRECLSHRDHYFKKYL